MISLFNKSQKVLKQMKYYSDQQGIINRFMKEKEGWHSHIDKAKNTILDFCKDKNGSIAILGSGWLLDVPIEELNNTFNNVYLIDIIHSPQIKHLVKKYNKIKCIEADITGGMIHSVYNEVNKCLKKKEAFNPSKMNISNFNLDKETDYIISLNILTQLDTLLVEYITSKINVDDDNLNIFRKNIQTAHLDYLKKHASCLITDYEEWTFNTLLNEINTKNLLFCSLPKDKNTKYWDWLFDMTGNYNINKKTILKVLSTTFNN